jgi:putative transposase
MPNYRRWYMPGGTYFFTVALADRRQTLLVEHVARLRRAVATVRRKRPFELCAAVVLPEHLHMIWTLPPGDADFSTRWRLIKAGFSAGLDPAADRRASLRHKHEKGLWQRRFVEHRIRDETDLESHVDYIHFNPVKHGYVTRPADWPYSSIHRYIRRGWIDPDWGGTGRESELDLG